MGREKVGDIIGSLSTPSLTTNCAFQQKIQIVPYCQRKYLKVLN